MSKGTGVNLNFFLRASLFGNNLALSLDRFILIRDIPTPRPAADSPNTQTYIQP